MKVTYLRTAYVDRVGSIVQARDLEDGEIGKTLDHDGYYNLRNNYFYWKTGRESLWDGTFSREYVLSRPHYLTVKVEILE